jgi:hypothetical protein
MQLFGRRCRWVIYFFHQLLFPLGVGVRPLWRGAARTTPHSRAMSGLRGRSHLTAAAMPSVDPDEIVQRVLGAFASGKNKLLNPALTKPKRVPTCTRRRPPPLLEQPRVSLSAEAGRTCLHLSAGARPSLVVFSRPLIPRPPSPIPHPPSPIPHPPSPPRTHSPRRGHRQQRVHVAPR